MTNQESERFVAALDATRGEPRPEFVAELGQRLREEAASTAVSDIVWTGDQNGPVETNLVIDFEQQPDRSNARPDRKRSFSVVIAAAATMLVVAAVVALTARDSGDIQPDAPSSPSITEPSPPPSTVDPPAPPSVFDPVSSYRWSLVFPDCCPGGASPDGAMRGVAAGGPGLVAVGSDGSNDDGPDAVVWTSIDGISWSRLPHDEAVLGSGGMESVTEGGPGLVAVGAGGSFVGGFDAVVWTSVDGITWSRVAHDEAVFGGPDSVGMNSVTAGGPGLIAVGGLGIQLPFGIIPALVMITRPCGPPLTGSPGPASLTTKKYSALPVMRK